MLDFKFTNPKTWERAIQFIEASLVGILGAVGGAMIDAAIEYWTAAPGKAFDKAALRDMWHVAQASGIMAFGAYWKTKFRHPLAHVGQANDKRGTKTANVVAQVLEQAEKTADPRDVPLDPAAEIDALNPAQHETFLRVFNGKINQGARFTDAQRDALKEAKRQ